MPNVVLSAPLDVIDEAKRGVLEFGQPRTSIQRRPGISVPTPHQTTKSWGDGRVATAAGTGWCWEPLATDLHPGGQGVFGRSLPTEARAEFGSNLGDEAALFRDSAASPHMGEGSRKGDLKTACLTHPASIPQLAGHPITRSKDKERNACFPESKENSNETRSMECKNAHGHWQRKQTRAHDSHCRP